jgi:hypothetical protein
MKLTTVLASVNNNPEYYLFIPKQILFWQKFNIKFIAIFIGETIPEDLNNCSENIILWNKNLDINSSFVAQNIRIYYPSLLDIPDDELVMITDMDMLPLNKSYYCDGLDDFKTEDFIYYRHIDGNQIYMCYNAAHPSVWKSVFSINNEEDIGKKIYETYNQFYNGIPGSTGWFTDQELMYKHLFNYPNLKVLNRPIKRLEMWNYDEYLKNKSRNFINLYDDAHFHRSYKKNEFYILHAENQINLLYK